MQRAWSLGLLAALASPVAAQGLEKPVRLKAGDAFVDTGPSIGHSGPLFADLDGDGKKDLLVGNFKGTIQVYKNTGEKQPSLVSVGLLQADGKDALVHNW